MASLAQIHPWVLYVLSTVEALIGIRTVRTGASVPASLLPQSVNVRPRQSPQAEGHEECDEHRQADGQGQVLGSGFLSASSLLIPGLPRPS